MQDTAVDFTGLYDGRPAPDHYIAPEEDKVLAQKLSEWRDKAYRWRAPWERTWEINRAYLKGDQLLGRHRVTGEIIRLSAEDSRRLRSQNNILRPVSRSLIGKLCRMIPNFRIIPASSDFDEQNGVRTANQILQYARRKEDLDLIYQSLCEHLPADGNAFAELCWDPLGGRKIAYCETCHFFDYDTDSLVGQPCPQCTMQRQEEQQVAQLSAETMKIEAMTAAMGALPPGMDIAPEEIEQGLPQLPPQQPQLGALPPDQEPAPMVEANEGDFRLFVRDPMDVFLPPGCTDIRVASRIMVREVIEVSAACAQHPTFAPFFKPDTDVAREYTTRHQTGSSFSMNTEDLDDHLFIYRFYEKATEMYPEGRIITMINDIIVEEKPGLWGKFKRHPIYHFGFDPVKGEVYYDSFISQAWHRQKELNLLETQKREHLELLLKQKLFVPFGSRIGADELTSETSQIIFYNNAAGPITPLQMPDLPQGVWARGQELVNDVRTQASVTESEQGVMGSDPNGRAAAIINAEADQQVGPIMRRNNSEWRELTRGIIVLYQCYAHPERLATIAGPEGTQMVSFAKLQFLRDGWDIELEEEDSASRNPAVRLTQAMELSQVGGGAFFTDPMTGMFDKKAFARFARLQVPDTGYDVEATERAAASQIPELVMNGGQWMPRTFDVPQIFVEEIGAWLRGPGRKADPMVSQQIEQIWQYYQMWAMQGVMPPMPMMGPQQASQPGQQGMSAPGGTPANPGFLGTDVGSAAQTSINQADVAGEQAAQQSLGAA